MNKQILTGAESFERIVVVEFKHIKRLPHEAADLDTVSFIKQYDKNGCKIGLQ